MHVQSGEVQSCPADSCNSLCMLKLLESSNCSKLSHRWLWVLLQLAHNVLRVHDSQNPVQHHVSTDLEVSYEVCSHCCSNICSNIRRKFRSQTLDNMGRWKSRGGKSQRREKKKKKDQRRERVRMARIKVEKSQNTVFFPLKRRVRSHRARWEMKNCTPLRRKTHYQVKMHKAPHCRNTFGSWDVQKVHAVVARSRFRSQNVQNIIFEALSEIRMRFHVAGARESAPCQSQQNARLLQEILKGWLARNMRRGSAKMHFAWQAQYKRHIVRHIRRSGHFLRSVAFWIIRSSGLLRLYCVTGAALRMTWPHFFVAVGII